VPVKPLKPEAPSNKPLEELKSEYSRKLSEIAYPKLQRLPVKPEIPQSDPWLEILTLIITGASLLICWWNFRDGAISTFIFGAWFNSLRNSRLKTQEEQAIQRDTEYVIVCDQLNEKYNRELKEYKRISKSLEEDYERRKNIVHIKICEIEAARQKDYDAECKALELNYHQLCRKIFDTNNEIQAAYEQANKIWLDEERKWKKVLSTAEMQINQFKLDFESIQFAEKQKYNAVELSISTRLSNLRSAQSEYKTQVSIAESNSRQLQLDSYLEQLIIRDAGIKGITTPRILALESFGIETAKDVGILGYQKVPGIGPILSKRLMDWRTNTSKNFVPSTTLPTIERSRINARFAPALMPMQQFIVVQFDEMNNLKKNLSQKLTEISNMSTIAAKNAATAQAHLNALFKLK
jgi:hypothetical protein